MPLASAKIGLLSGHCGDAREFSPLGNHAFRQDEWG